MLLTVLMACGMVTGAATQASAGITCVPVKAPKACEGVERCEWGGDPDAVWVEVKGGTRKLALSRAAEVRANVKAAKVKPRTLSIQARYGKKNRIALSKGYRLKGKHWYFSYKKNCWYVR
ncbi:hypothetical protein [Actinocorallia populi]|uniref:hypothetical protein n=1 Tax=Actinocorallia populi TaxID=2079200 RepID=UPI000D08E806|nr:hypothetical protein [Actinocorallia populi]